MYIASVNQKHQLYTVSVRPVHRAQEIHLSTSKWISWGDCQFTEMNMGTTVSNWMALGGEHVHHCHTPLQSAQSGYRQAADTSA